MPLRSVEAATRDDAIAAAREQFGPSARVVGVRRVRSGGVLGFFATERYVAEVAEHPDAPGLPVPAPARPSGTAAAARSVAAAKPAQAAAPADSPAVVTTRGSSARGTAPARNGAAAYAAEARTSPSPAARAVTTDKPRWRTDEERLAEIAGLLAAAAAEEPVEDDAVPAVAPARGGYQRASFPPATRLSGAMLAASGATADEDDDEPVGTAAPAAPSPFTAALARMVAGDREVRQAVEDALDQPAVRQALRETGRRPIGPAPIRRADTSVWSRSAHQEEDPVALQDYTPPPPSGTAPVDYPTWTAEPEPAPSSSREEAIAAVLRSALAQGHSDEALAGILRKVLDDTAPQTAVSTPTAAAPVFEAPSFEAPSFEAPPFEAPPFEAPSFEAPSFEAPSFETPAFQAPSFEAPSFETPSFETPSFETAPIETSAPDAPSFGLDVHATGPVETAALEATVVDPPATDTSVAATEPTAVEPPAAEPSAVVAEAAPGEPMTAPAEPAPTAATAPMVADTEREIGSFDLFGPAPAAAPAEAPEPVAPAWQETLWGETVVPGRAPVDAPAVEEPVAVPAETIETAEVAADVGEAAADEAALEETAAHETVDEVVSEEIAAESAGESAEVGQQHEEAAQPAAAAPLLARTASDPAPLSLDATTVMPPLSLLPPLPSSRHRGRPPVPPASRPPVPPSRPAAAKTPTQDAPAPAPAGLLATVTRLPVAPLSEHFDAIAAAVEASVDLPTGQDAPEITVEHPVPAGGPGPRPPAERQVSSTDDTTDDALDAATEETAAPVPAAAPRTAAEVFAGLRSLGVPERLLGSSFVDDVAEQGAYAALTRALALRLPPAPVAPDGAGEVLFVVGPGVEALRAARSLAISLRLDPDRVQWAARGDLAGLAPKGTRMTTVESAIDRRQDVAAASTVTIVAVDAPLRTDAYWMSQMLAVWAPVAVWAVVEATRKPEDLEPWVAGLPRLDAIMVQDTDLSADPAAVLAGVEAPVALIDGVRATPHRWASLLCERLETAQA